MERPFYNIKDYQARKSFGYLIRRSSNMITTQFETLFAEKDASFIQFVILMNLRDKLATNACELCNNICYDSGALTRIIDQLEEKKFIKRERSTEDRRRVELKLTEKGRKAVESWLPLVIDKYNLWFSEFTKDEAETFIRLMTKLATKISETQKPRAQYVDS